MTARLLTLLVASAAVAGCTTYHPVQTTTGNWAAARELAYAQPVGAATDAAVSTASGIGDLSPSTASSVAVAPLPPLESTAYVSPAANNAPISFGQPGGADPIWNDPQATVSVTETVAVDTVVVNADGTAVDVETVAVETVSEQSQELAARGNAPTDLPPPALSGVGFMWPADGPARGAKAGNVAGHIANGLIIDAQAGSPILASENGVVVYASSEMAAYGNMIVVRHDGNYTTAYGHAASLNVAPGDIVRRGQQIGTVGSTGRVESAQVYFEMRAGSDVVDPKAYLAPRSQVAAG